MSWWDWALLKTPPLQEDDDRLREALFELHATLLEASRAGHGFSPYAKLARKALRAIHWV